MGSKSKSNDDSIGDVDNLVVSAPDRVVISVVLSVGGDGISSIVVDVVNSVSVVSVLVSVVEYSVVVVERKALGVPSSSQDDL